MNLLITGSPDGLTVMIPKKMAEFEKKNSINIARDSEGTLAFLTTSEWQLGFCMEKWPDS